MFTVVMVIIEAIKFPNLKGIFQLDPAIWSQTNMWRTYNWMGKHSASSESLVQLTPSL